MNFMLLARTMETFWYGPGVVDAEEDEHGVWVVDVVRRATIRS